MSKKSGYTIAGQNIMALSGVVVLGAIGLFIQNALRPVPDMDFQLLLYYAFQAGCAVFIFGALMAVVGSVIQAIWSTKHSDQ